MSVMISAIVGVNVELVVTLLMGVSKGGCCRGYCW